MEPLHYEGVLVGWILLGIHCFLTAGLGGYPVPAVEEQIPGPEEKVILLEEMAVGMDQVVIAVEFHLVLQEVEQIQVAALVVVHALEIPVTAVLTAQA